MVRRRALLPGLATAAAVAAAFAWPGPSLEIALASSVPEAARAALLERARARGRLPVIVGLAGPGITNVKLFEGIPFLALTASPAALERLLAHPLVESVQEDAAAAPQ